MRLHRPLTAERAIRAGSIPDLPYICNKGGAGTVYGRQPFLPVGAPAVNSGVQRGRGHSLYGAVAASRSCLPAALPGSWLRQGSGRPGPEQLTRRGSAAGFLRYASALCWEPSDRGSVAAGCAQRGLFNFGRHVGNGHALPCVNNSAPFEFPSRWERS